MRIDFTKQNREIVKKTNKQTNKKQNQKEKDKKRNKPTYI